jgi:alpha-amylase
MKNICLYFQIHHSFHQKIFRFFDIGDSKSYFDDLRIEREIQDAVANFYLPTNDFLLTLINQYHGKLKLVYNISDTALDQFLRYTPELFTSFRKLADTGHVEFTGSAISHSIGSLAENSKNDFIESIKASAKRTEYYFGQKPKLFVNTDLLFNNQIAQMAAKAGYSAILTNGIKRILNWRSPNYLYCSEDPQQIRILLRNDKISNELSAILDNSNQIEAKKQLEQLFFNLELIPPDEPILNIYLNYRLLGGANRIKKQRLFRSFITEIINRKSYCFNLPAQIVEQYAPVSEIGTDEPVCWTEGFHSGYYPGNELQKDAIRQLYRLSKKIGATSNNNLKIDWRYLQSSDHFHLMDENHPDYQSNPSESATFKSKYDAYINYMNILASFRKRLKIENQKAPHKVISKVKYPHFHKI